MRFVYPELFRQCEFTPYIYPELPPPSCSDIMYICSVPVPWRHPASLQLSSVSDGPEPPPSHVLVTGSHFVFGHVIDMSCMDRSKERVPEAWDGPDLLLAIKVTLSS